MRGVRSHNLSRQWRLMAVAGALALTAAACGGGDSDNNDSAAGGTDTTAVEETTTTTVAGDPNASTTTTGAVTGATTATTKKSTTATTKKSAVAPGKGSAGVTNVSGGVQNVTGTTAVNKAAQPGGTITWLKPGEIPGLDPLNMTNSGASDGPLGMAVFDVLVYSDGGVVKPQVAESLTSADALVWTLKIHPGVKFSDGTPYNAEAIKFNYERLKDPANKANRAALAQQMQTIEVVDDVTLKITLKSKNAVFAQTVALIPFIGSPKAIQEKGADKFNNEPVGAGPFVLKSWTRDSQATFERNPNYWNAPLPHVDRIIFKPVVDESQRLNTFCAGQANMAFIGAVGNADTVNKQKCGTINPLVLNGGTDLMMNTRKPPFNNLNARLAVAHAIDPDEYSRVATNGLIAPMRSIFRTDSPFYDPNILQPAHDPARAQQLFDLAASELGGPVTFTITTFPSPNYQTTATYVQGVLQKYKNVKVDLVTEASAQHITNANTSNFTMSVFGNIFDDPEPTWTAINTCNAQPNYTGFCDPAFDAAVAENQTTLDANRRIQVLKDAQKIYYSKVPMLFVEQRYSWVFTNPQVQDFHFVNDGLPLLDRFWLKTR